MPHPASLPPSPLQTLNAIFAELATISAVHNTSQPDPAEPTHHLTTSSTSTNLKAHALPDAARPLLLTLHVIFPHLLLPALDLLDRGLVTRIVLTPPHTTRFGNAEIAHTSDADSIANGTPLHYHHPHNPDQARKEVLTHEITSTSILYNTPSTSSRFNRRSHGNHSPGYGNEAETDATGNDGKKYHVYLRAWSCSCPAFALAAFGEDGLGAGDGADEGQVGEGGAAAGAAGYEWGTDAMRAPYRPPLAETKEHSTLGLGFGGLMLHAPGTGSAAGKAQNLPPLCKHLLAAALGELCGGFFGEKVDVDGDGDRKWRVRGMREKIVTIEEAAGWAAGASL